MTCIETMDMIVCLIEICKVFTADAEDVVKVSQRLIYIRNQFYSYPFDVDCCRGFKALRCCYCTLISTMPC